MVILVCTFAFAAYNAYHREEQARIVLSVVNGARNIMTAKVAVRAELTVANLILEAPGSGELRSCGAVRQTA